jgi:hypothetical protein
MSALAASDRNNDPLKIHLPSVRGSEIVLIGPISKISNSQMVSRRQRQGIYNQLPTRKQ